MGFDAGFLSWVKLEYVPAVGSQAFTSGNGSATHAVPDPSQHHVAESVPFGIAWFAKLLYGTARFIRHIALTPFIAHKFNGKLSAKWILGVARGARSAASFACARVVL